MLMLTQRKLFARKTYIEYNKNIYILITHENTNSDMPFERNNIALTTTLEIYIIILSSKIFFIQ